LFDLLKCDFASKLLLDFPDVFNILVKLSLETNNDLKEVIVDKMLEYCEKVGQSDIEDIM